MSVLYIYTSDFDYNQPPVTLVNPFPLLLSPFFLLTSLPSMTLSVFHAGHIQVVIATVYSWSQWSYHIHQTVLLTPLHPNLRLLWSFLTLFHGASWPLKGGVIDVLFSHLFSALCTVISLWIICHRLQKRSYFDQTEDSTIYEYKHTSLEGTWITCPFTKHREEIFPRSCDHSSCKFWPNLQYRACISSYTVGLGFKPKENDYPSLFSVASVGTSCLIGW